MSSSKNTNKFEKVLAEKLPTLKAENIKTSLKRILNETEKELTKTQYNNAVSFISSISKLHSDKVIIALYDHVLSAQGMYGGKTAERKHWFKGTAIGGMECSNPNR